MKKRKFSLISALIGASSALAILALVAFNSDHENSATKMFAPVLAINIPQEVNFAGQSLSLDRYDLRERFDYEITSFSYHHSRTLSSIKQANRYFPIIEPILIEEGIPTDFKYLALIESNLDKRAKSSVGAVGLWQLMPETAKELGLEITDEVDERYHIEKATRGACEYLKASYEKFGDWLLVAASYNAGRGRVNSAKRDQQQEEFANLLLPTETSRYVFRLFAIKELMSKPKNYGFILKKEDLYPLISYKEIEVDSTVNNWTEFAKQYDISYYELKEFNVWLRDNKLKNPKNKTYKIAIPDKNEFFTSKNTIDVCDKNWIE